MTEPSLEAYVRQYRNLVTLGVSEATKALVRRAAMESARRRNEDVEAWARALAESVAHLTD